jgi:ferredoxin--NADP+ reductase
MAGPKHGMARVTERRAVTSGLWIVRLRPDREIPFLPGQYVTIGLPIGNKLVERPYSVVSAPDDPELEFFLEVVPNGKLSPSLCEVPVGGQVYVRPEAKGRFNLDTESGHRRHFMIATVTGVAPFVSMIRSLIPGKGRDGPPPYQIALLDAASISGELAYRSELAQAAQRSSWFHYIPTISRIWLDPGWMGERGRAEDVARKYLDALDFSPDVTTVYLCGNPYMIRAMEGVLERAGFPKTSVKREIYWPAD